MNRIKIQVFLLLLLLINNFDISAQTWEKINSIFPSTDTLLQNATINFINKDTGWVITSGSSKFDAQSIKLLETKNGGLEWQLELDLTLFSSFSHTTNSFDKNNIWFMGEAGDLILSSDKGENWDTSRVTYDNLSSAGWYFTSLFFFNDKNGIAFNNYRWFTKNGGYTWQKDGDTISVFPATTDVHFINERVGWIVGNFNLFATDGGYIAKTTDSGKTWKYYDSLFTPIMYGIDFIDSLKGFAVGTNWSFSTGFIYSTTDGGMNWHWQQFSNSGAFWDIGFLDDKNGWVAGSGKILRTTNGGETWKTHVDTIESDFKQMIMLKKDKVAYVLGDDWNGYSHTLLRADLSNITSVAYEKDNLLEQLLLLNNYPNPFNPSTTISYFIPTSTFVILKIYNFLGEEILTLVNKEQSAGKYKVKFEGNNLSSGIYFYQIKTDKYIQSKKMLLLR